VPSSSTAWPLSRTGRRSPRSIGAASDALNRVWGALTSGRPSKIAVAMTWLGLAVLAI
jgi:hypothetical protein